jgi:glycosyltransferase involved in cell wall biosynthesis
VSTCSQSEDRTDANTVGVVVIGRNEGERLRRCLASLGGRCARIVYVDSGSTDGSPEFAQSIGADVVSLDLSKPFSMARARNAGVARLRELMPDATFVQLVDGDCGVAAEWLETATAWLIAHPRTVAVCGRRRERFPERSVYNRFCDIEWNTPVGSAKACGGDAMMRAEALRAAGGFREDLIAGEEPELCLRLRQAGGEIDRIDAEMTEHDAAILSWTPWWRRHVRGGYGAMDVVSRLGKGPDVPFVFLTKSVRLWTLGWAGLTLAGAGAALALNGGAFAAFTILVLSLGAWGLQAFKIGTHARRRGADWGTALAYGVCVMIAKWAQLQGQFRYLRDVRRKNTPQLIEYKRGAT